MYSLRFMLLAVLVVFTLAGFTGCTDSGNKNSFEYLPIYGDGSVDNSEPVAQVGDIVITEKMMDVRFEELPVRLQSRYSSEEGRRLLLKKMVDETVMVLGAIEQELYNDPEVIRTLLAHRRITLDSAMRNIGLLKGAKPSEDQVRDYFQKNRDKYRRIASAKGRHVECLTRDDADKAFQRLSDGGVGNNWPHVVNDYSINKETSRMAGEFGWFDGGSYLPSIENYADFTKVAIELDVGLNEPILVNNHWHVVEILEKKFARNMTFAEARETVKMGMLAGFQDGIIKDYLNEGRERLDVSLLGDFAPGKGLSGSQIFDRAMLLTDLVEKIDMLSLVIEDFPESERADDALFWSANAALEVWNDRGVAVRYMETLVRDYPSSEFVDQAQFLLENMGTSQVTSPTSIEELRRNIK